MRKTYESKIVAIFCIIDDIVKALGFRDDPQCLMSSSEVLSAAVISHLFFGGNYSKTLTFLAHASVFSYVLSESRFLRRLQRFEGHVKYITHILSKVMAHAGPCSEYAVDSFPVAVCENIRANRCRLASGKVYRGYIPSKRTYFHGIKVHMVVRLDGFITEFELSAASVNDAKGLYFLSFEEGTVYADRGYKDYFAEDGLLLEGVELIPIRVKGSKRYDRNKQYLAKSRRRIVETVASVINSFFPKRIRAVTWNGFIMKVSLFMLAYNIHRFLKVAILKVAI